MRNRKTKLIITNGKYNEEFGKASWRDGSAVKGADCSCRGPEFSPQNPHGGSHLSAATVPEGSTVFSVFCCLLWSLGRHMQNVNIYKI